MSNMSYCRFQNTNRDLSDCSEALGNFLYGDEEIDQGERKYAALLLSKAVDMLSNLANFENKSVGNFVTEAYDSFDQEGFFEDLITKINPS